MFGAQPTRSTGRGAVRARTPAAVEAQVTTQTLLETIIGTDEDSRAPALMLHWAMNAMRAQWAAYYTLDETGQLQRLAKASAASTSGCMPLPAGTYSASESLSIDWWVRAAGKASTTSSSGATLTLT